MACKVDTTLFAIINTRARRDRGGADKKGTFPDDACTSNGAPCAVSKNAKHIIIIKINNEV